MRSAIAWTASRPLGHRKRSFSVGTATYGSPSPPTQVKRSSFIQGREARRLPAGARGPELAEEPSSNAVRRPHRRRIPSTSTESGRRGVAGVDRHEEPVKTPSPSRRTGRLDVGPHRANAGWAASPRSHMLSGSSRFGRPGRARVEGGRLTRHLRLGKRNSDPDRDGQLVPVRSAERGRAREPVRHGDGSSTRRHRRARERRKHGRSSTSAKRQRQGIDEMGVRRLGQSRRRTSRTAAPGPRQERGVRRVMLLGGSARRGQRFSRERPRHVTHRRAALAPLRLSPVHRFRRSLNAPPV